MAGVETIEALIVVRTYPTPAKKNVEVSCTAGITRDGKWVRLFPIPYRFLDDDKRFHKYQWIKANVRKAADHRAESACKGHHLNCTDGELGASWRSWRARYGDEWEAKFRKRYERDMIERLDTHFFVGTLKAHPAEWNIVGLFYPPKTTGNLFGPN